jgi:chromosome segregation ATPase
MAKNGGVIDKIMMNKKKNIQVENTKYIMDWIKLIQDDVTEIKNNCEANSRKIKDRDEEVGSRLSRFEGKGIKNEVDIENLFKILTQMKSDFEQLPSDMEAINESVKSIVEQISLFEAKYDSLTKDFLNKISETEIKMRAEVDSIDKKTQGSINILGTNLQSVLEKMNDLSENVKSLSTNIEMLDKGLNKISDDCQENHSQLKTECERNEIRMKNCAKKCLDREKQFNKNLEDSLKLLDQKNENYSVNMADIEKKLCSSQNKIDVLSENYVKLEASVKKKLEKHRQQESNLESKISKFEGELKNHDRSIIDLSSDLKYNKTEISGVERAFSTMQNLQQEIRTRTSALDKPRDNSGGSGLLDMATTIAKFTPLAPAVPFAEALLKK